MQAAMLQEKHLAVTKTTVASKKILHKTA